MKEVEYVWSKVDVKFQRQTSGGTHERTRCAPSPWNPGAVELCCDTGDWKDETSFDCGVLECSFMKFGLYSVVNRELFKVSKQENNMIMMI